MSLGLILDDPGPQEAGLAVGVVPFPGRSDDSVVELGAAIANVFGPIRISERMSGLVRSGAPAASASGIKLPQAGGIL